MCSPGECLEVSFKQCLFSGLTPSLVVAVPASSRASPLPQVSALTKGFVNDTDHCGSGLARDEARKKHRPTFGQSTNRAARDLAWLATSVTAVLSHHIPRNGGPMANKRLATCPSALNTAPSSAAAIPNANGPGRTSPRANSCCGNGRATRRQSYSMPLELISAAPCTTQVCASPRRRMRMLTSPFNEGSNPLNDAA